MLKRQACAVSKNTLCQMICAALIISALVSCGRDNPAIPAGMIPHRLANQYQVEIWVRAGSSDQFIKQMVTLPAGWWVASPSIIEGKP
jgi:hypothetical protein